MSEDQLGGFPCCRLVPHLIPDWAEVVEDVEPTITAGAVLTFPSFLKGRETIIDGKMMRA